MENRRDDDRSNVRFWIKAVVDGGEEIDAQLVDHSATGIGLIFVKPVTIGSRIRVMIGQDKYEGTTKYCRQLEGKRGYAVGLRLG
jgi:hypothetical protein